MHGWREIIPEEKQVFLVGFSLFALRFPAFSRGDQKPTKLIYFNHYYDFPVFMVHGFYMIGTFVMKELRIKMNAKAIN